MKKILVIQNKRIGDVLLASIIPNNLKKIFPNSHISFVCYDYAAPVLYNNPNVDEIIAIDEKKLKKVNQLLLFAMQIRRQNYDLVIDPYVKFQSQLISFFSGAKHRIGHSKKTLPFSYTQKIPLLEKGVSPYGKAIDDRVNLIQHLEPEMEFDVYPKLFLTEEEKEEGREELRDLDPSRKTLMFGALGSDATKSLPANYVAELLDFISSRYQLNILLNYVPSQKKTVQQIMEKTRNKEAIYSNITAKNIRGFIKLMYHCDFLVANEGGSVHIAKALNKPTFAIYAPYIIKEVWATFENEAQNRSIHLKEVDPELFKNKTRKEIKENSQELYRSFRPELITPSLTRFLDRHAC